MISLTISEILNFSFFKKKLCHDNFLTELILEHLEVIVYLVTECYLQYEKAARLTGPAIRGQARVKDEQSCGHACNEAPFTCLSFSFK